jgi:alkylresorcinol/alkylpyrone synthase
MIRCAGDGDHDPLAPAVIAGLGLAHPAHRVPQLEVEAFAARWFRGRNPDLDRLLPVFRHAAIGQRYFVLPPEEYATDSTLAGRNRAFVEAAERLCAEAATEAIEDAGLTSGAITHVILVTSTGLATPTLETHFGPLIGLAPSARRIPLWGLGCAGGASALALSRELASNPDRTVLVVAVELCSLTFIPQDASNANIVATALFGDGAAAAVITHAGRRPGLLLGHHVEELIPDSRDVMGWDLTTEGLQVIFLSRIPALVTETYRGTVTRALAPHGLGVGQLECLATHPGGRRVIEAEEAALGLGSGRFAAAREALHRFGNVSSVSVFHVLHLLRERGLWGRPGILSAFGPGFTSHVIALPGDERVSPQSGGR